MSQIHHARGPELMSMTGVNLIYFTNHLLFVQNRE